jgi:phage host-nuclease inhibitor protein Gam
MGYVAVISDLFGISENTTFFVLFIGIVILVIANVAQLILANMKSKKFADFEEYVDRNIKEKEALNLRSKRLGKEKDQVIKQFEEFLAKYNEEKEKNEEKVANLELTIKNYEEELTKIPAMEDEMKFYRKKIGDLNNERAELQKEFETEKAKIKAKHDEEIRILKQEMENLVSRHDSEKRKLNEEFNIEKSGITNRYDTEIGQLKKVLEDNAAAHETRVEEIKSKTKETISKFVVEKEQMINKLRSKNEELKKEIDRLNKEIKVLEVEHF